MTQDVQVDGDEGGGEWSLAFAGDCILDDAMADAPVGDAVAEAFDEAAYAFANVEAPVAGAGEPATKSGPHKRQAPGAIEALAGIGVDVACLANNHVMDYGPEGLRATVERCEDEGMDTVGAGETPADALAPLVLDVDGRSVAVVNVCEREFGVAADDGPGTAWVDHPAAREVVREASDEYDVVVVVSHGGVEYVPFPPASRQRTLRAFVDAGADAVVGHHPHVPQGWETYDGAPVLYSLGNFLFTMGDRPSTQWGLLASLEFDGDSVDRVRVTLTEQEDGRAVLMRETRPEGGSRNGRAAEPRTDDGDGGARAGRDPDEYRDYLDRVSAVTADRDALRAHWQETADRLFDQRYAGWLRTGTASGPQQTVTEPGAAFGDAFDGDARAGELLVLLNVVRNESHRDVVETALSVRAGESEDLRSAEVEEAVRDLLEWTEDRPLYDRPSLPRKALRALRRRLG